MHRLIVHRCGAENVRAVARETNTSGRGYWWRLAVKGGNLVDARVRLMRLPEDLDALIYPFRGGNFGTMVLERTRPVVWSSNLLWFRTWSERESAASAIDQASSGQPTKRTENPFCWVRADQPAEGAGDPPQVG